MPVGLVCLYMQNFGMPADCLPSGGAENEAEPDAETLEYLTGKKEVPVPTFFIGAFGAGSRSSPALFAPRPSRAYLLWAD